MIIAMTNLDYDLIINIEKKLSLNKDLLEILIAYCQEKQEKSDFVTTINSILEIIIEKQSELTKDFDNFLLSI